MARQPLQQSQAWEAGQSLVSRAHPAKQIMALHQSLASTVDFQVVHFNLLIGIMAVAVPSFVDTHFPLNLSEFSLSDEQLGPTKL